MRRSKGEKEDLVNKIRLEMQEHEEDIKILERIKLKLKMRMLDLVQKCPHLHVKETHCLEGGICRTRKLCEDCKGYVS